MYHHVTRDGGSLSVSAAHFESQMRGLAQRGYKTLRADDLAAFYNGKPMPRKSVLITFDDGYLDNWVYAHPVLERYGLNAMLFTVTGLIGQGPARPCAGGNAELPACPPHKQAKQIMFSDNPDTVMLRWSELEAMQSAGTFEIHSHTHTHKRWDLLCDSEQEKNERFHADLEQSRLALSQRLGQESAHLCWPQGYTDTDYKRIAADHGFRYFYTTDARGQNTVKSDVGHIYRFAVRNRAYPWLAQRVWLARHPVLGPLYNRWKAGAVNQQSFAMLCMVPVF